MLCLVNACYLSYASRHSIVVTMQPVFIGALHLDMSCVLCLVTCVLSSYLRYASHNLLSGGGMGAICLFKPVYRMQSSSGRIVCTGGWWGWLWWWRREIGRTAGVRVDVEAGVL